jgi:Ca2+-binding RTX toxin-like protein
MGVWNPGPGPTAGNDTFFGGPTAEVVDGGGGNDQLHGSGEGDQLSGSDGNDQLHGNGGNDVLNGDIGDDFLNGNIGVDTYIGGSGNDSVTLWSLDATQAVVASLLTQTVTNDGFGNAETLSSIEGFGGGTRFADTFDGDNNNNFIQGDTGDTLRGHGGNDGFGIAGAPVLVDGGDGNDNLHVGNNQTLVDTNGDGMAEIVFATQGVTVNLAQGRIINDGFGGSNAEGSLVSIENVHGGGLGDTLIGDGGNNFLAGNGGNDALSGGAGSDNLMGGEGVDTHDGGDGDDRIEFGNWHATQAVVASLLTQTISNDGFGNAETFTSIEVLGNGTRFADTFEGNDAANNLSGDRADTLRGLGGNDNINIGAAPSLVDGGAGIDWLHANMGWTLVDANNDGIAEQVFATQGMVINLAIGQIVSDGFGNSGTLVSVENVNGTQFNDTITGDADSNSLNGNNGDDQISGGGANDVLSGGNGNDTLNGEAGDDNMNGGAGLDTLSGGDGTDAAGFYSQDATQAVVVSLLAQTVTNDGYGNAETLSSIENIFGGTRFADTFEGNSANNFIQGDAGDTLTGLGGNDGFGVARAPTLVDGGEGNDNLHMNLNNTLIDTNDDGFAEVVSASQGAVVNLELGQILNDGFGGSSAPGALVSIENVYGGNFNDTLTGDANNNFINGNAGDDTLNGGGGSDVLWGGRGVDTHNGGDGDDRIEFGNWDATQAVVASLLTQTITNDGYGNAETFTSIEGLGGATRFADTLEGNNAANQIFGDKGDTLSGLDGNDTIHIGAAAGLADGGTGVDTLNTLGWTLVDANNDGIAERLDATQGMVINLALNQIVSDGFGNSGAVAGIENVNGTNFNDTITGNGSDNTLNGNNGNDILFGGTGLDRLQGGEGDDVLRVEVTPTEGIVGGENFGGGNGFDTIRFGVSGGAPSINGSPSQFLNGLFYFAGVNSIERFEFAGGGNANAQFLLGQFGAGMSSTLQIKGSDNLDNFIIIATTAGASTTVGLNFTFENWTPTIADVEVEDFVLYDDLLIFLASGLLTAGVQLTGSAMSELIQGGAYNDTLQGGEGNDILAGLGGIDQMFGGDGNDALIAGAGEDHSLEVFDGGAGRDSLAAVGNVTFTGSLISIEGFSFNRNADASMTIAWDIVKTMPTDVSVIGSDFANRINVFMDEADLVDLSQWRFANLYWTDSQDLITVAGSDGDDEISGTLKRDLIDGGDGNDRLIGGAGDDTIIDMEGDTLEIDGGFGNDTITIGRGFSSGTVTGGDGLDQLNVSAGALDDLVFDGIEILNTGGARITATAAQMESFDTIRRSADLAAGSVLLTLAEAGTVDLADEVAGRALNLIGSSGDDTVTAGNKNDTVNGAGGNDTIFGGLGNDKLSGGADNDVLYGGVGNDSYDGGDGIDSVYFSSATNAVTVNLSLATAQANGTEGSDIFLDIENLRGSNFNDFLTGDDDNNHLEGLNGNDQLEGGSGDDLLDGGGGLDQLNGGDGDDILQVTFSPTNGMSVFTPPGGPTQRESLIGGEGYDTLRIGGTGIETVTSVPNAAWSGTFLNANLDSIDRLEFTDTNRVVAVFSSTQMGTGLSSDFTIVGSSNQDSFQVIALSAGAHSLEHMNFTFLNWGFPLNYLPEVFEDFVHATDSFFFGASSNSTYAVELTGSSARETLGGGTLNDVLHGGGGDDILQGNLGVDQLYGGDGNDALVILTTDDTSLEVYDGGAGRDLLTPVGHVVFNGTFTSMEGFAFGQGLDSSITLSWDLASTMGPEVYVIGSATAQFANSINLLVSTPSVVNLSGWRFTNNYWSDTQDLISVTGSTGNDTITGTTRSDLIESGDGNDIMHAGTGIDTVSYAGSSGGIALNLGLLGIQATGGAGNDRISGFENVIGSAHDDNLVGTSGDNVMTAGTGNDIVSGGTGNDTISDIGGSTTSINAGGGDDIVTLGAAAFVSGSVNGNTGIDELNASGDLSVLTLSQFETLNTNGGTVTATVAQLEMFETIRISAANLTGMVNLIVAGGGGTINLATELVGRAATLTGTLLRDVITTAEGNDVIDGSDGNDTINAAAGNDTLIGGFGGDTLNGGDGDDSIDGGAGDDVISGGTGNDTVIDTAGLVASIQTGAGDDAITIGANTHQTGAINGGGGADQLTANGNLRAIVFTAIETLNTDGLEVTASATQLEAFDTIRVSVADLSGAVSLRLSAAGSVDLAGELLGRSVTFNGSSGNDVITTSDGADNINGGLGNDTLDGGLGNDTINGASGDDNITQRSNHGRDIINGSAGTDTYRLLGTAEAEVFRIYSRAEATAAGITGLLSNTEIVITRNGTNNASVIAELDNIEEIFINALASTADNGNGEVDGGVDGGDTIMVIGDFTSSSLAYSTIHIEGSSAGDTVDITGLASAHRVVFDSRGGNDTIRGDVRPQDVFNGVGLNDVRTGMIETVLDQPAALAFGASDGLDALVRGSLRGLLHAESTRYDFVFDRGYALRTEIRGLGQEGPSLNGIRFDDFDLSGGYNRTMVDTPDDLMPLDLTAHAGPALLAAPTFAPVDLAGFDRRYMPSDYDMLIA